MGMLRKRIHQLEVRQKTRMDSQAHQERLRQSDELSKKLWEQIHKKNLTRNYFAILETYSNYGMDSPEAKAAISEFIKKYEAVG